MAKPFVDRIEGDLAVVVVEGRERRVPLRQLPPGVREGCVLTDDLRAVDEEASRAVQDEVRARRERLATDDDGGDLAL